MALMNKGSGIIFLCDECGEEFETFEEDLLLAKDILKEEGWRIKKVAGEWEHYCKECR